MGPQTNRKKPGNRVFLQNLSRFCGFAVSAPTRQTKFHCSRFCGFRTDPSQEKAPPGFAVLRFPATLAAQYSAPRFCGFAVSAAIASRGSSRIAQEPPPLLAPLAPIFYRVEDRPPQRKHTRFGHRHMYGTVPPGLIPIARRAGISHGAASHAPPPARRAPRLFPEAAKRPAAHNAPHRCLLRIVPVAAASRTSTAPPTTTLHTSVPSSPTQSTSHSSLTAPSPASAPATSAHGITAPTTRAPGAAPRRPTPPGGRTNSHPPAHRQGGGAGAMANRTATAPTPPRAAPWQRTRDLLRSARNAAPPRQRRSLWCHFPQTDRAPSHPAGTRPARTAAPA